MSDGHRRYGRTSLGSQEIQNKSGRLTQSERLVLIVLGDGIAIDDLCAKLPSLHRERVELAVFRLVELGLAFETSATTMGLPGEQFSPKTVAAFLEQADADPVTIMATQEQINRTMRLKALRADLERVVQDARQQVEHGGAIAMPRKPRDRVSLSKVFPGGEAPTYVQEDIDELRRQAEQAVQRLTPRRGRGRNAPPLPLAEEHSTAGGAMMLIAVLFLVVVIIAVAAYMI